MRMSSHAGSDLGSADLSGLLDDSFALSSAGETGVDAFLDLTRSLALFAHE